MIPKDILEVAQIGASNRCEMGLRISYLADKICPTCSTGNLCVPYVCACNVDPEKLEKYIARVEIRKVKNAYETIGKQLQKKAFN